MCARVVRRLDDDAVRGDALAEWVEETHPDVLKIVAIEVLTKSHIVKESEQDQGEGSGVSSAV